MKKLDAFKLSLLAASVAGLGVGCASSGYARSDTDHSTGAGVSANVAGVGASAGAQVGTDRDATYMGTQPVHSARYDRDARRAEGAARVTVSALSFTPETRATWVNKFPFWDNNWQLRDVSVYTFAVPDPNLHASATADLPQFSENLPPGSVFVESAGGAGEVRTGMVIQHSPMLNR